MAQSSNFQSPMTPQGGKWRIRIIVAAVILLAAFTWWGYSSWRNKSTSLPSSTTGTPAPLSREDTTAAIEQDLQAVDLGNVGEELDQLDADINRL